MRTSHRTLLRTHHALPFTRHHARAITHAHHHTRAATRAPPHARHHALANKRATPHTRTTHAEPHTRHYTSAITTHAHHHTRTTIHVHNTRWTTRASPHTRHHARATSHAHVHHHAPCPRPGDSLRLCDALAKGQAARVERRTQPRATCANAAFPADAAAGAAAAAAASLRVAAGRHRRCRAAANTDLTRDPKCGEARHVEHSASCQVKLLSMGVGSVEGQPPVCERGRSDQMNLLSVSVGSVEGQPLCVSVGITTDETPVSAVSTANQNLGTFGPSSPPSPPLLVAIIRPWHANMPPLCVTCMRALVSCPRNPHCPHLEVAACLERSTRCRLLADSAARNNRHVAVQKAEGQRRCQPAGVAVGTVAVAAVLVAGGRSLGAAANRVGAAVLGIQQRPPDKTNRREQA
eukprot:186136-Chlamydomonas_euryale.AAC.6